VLFRSERNLQLRIAELEAAQRRLEEQEVNLIRLAGDLKIARDQAESANRAKTEFLAAMSHELRTPLNAIIGFSEIIQTETLGPVGSVKYRDYAGDIHESGQHLLDLINDILDLSKVESGLDELHEEDIEIPDLARSVWCLIQQRAQKQGVALALELPEAPPGLRADKRKLKQILVNLLSNAIKFTEAGGKVALKVWCRVDSGYVFQVVDTGIGIALDDIRKALSPFQQIDSEINRKYEGTGLGLPLTKALVEMHGGYLDLQSEVGVGTSVTVRFPAERIVPSPRDTLAVGATGRKSG
jgi:signal transduction histidine kinase